MAHTCPDCDRICYCGDDWDDTEFGYDYSCSCNCDDIEGPDSDDDWDEVAAQSGKEGK